MAIAFDAEVHSGGTYWPGSAVTSLTQSHTVGTGSNRLLIVAVTNYQVNTTTAVTYGGVSMTLINRSTGSVESLSQDTTLWYLVAPATGANNIVATLSGAASQYHSVHAMSYTGVNQTTPIDSNATGTSAAATSLTLSTTVVAENCWLVGASFSRDTTITAGASTTLRGLNTSSLVSGADSNAVVATGSRSLIWNSSGSATWPGGCIVSIAPAIITLSTDLVSYYKLDEASGNASDSHGSNTLTNNGSTAYATGKINNGADFESGSSNYFSISDASQVGLDITGNLSVSCWIKLESLPSAGRFTILSKLDFNASQQSYAFFVSNLSGTANLEVITSANGSANTAGTIAQTFSTATWYHLVFAYSTAGTCVVYVNGTSIGTISGLNTSLFNGTSPFWLGSSGNGTPIYFFDGFIDEAGIWSRTLSAGEVTSLYNGGAGLAYPFSAAATGNFLAFF